jgi:hypothetical protein
MRLSSFASGADRLSQETGKYYQGKLDMNKPPMVLTKRLETAFSQQWVLLLQEPIVLLLTFYASVINGTLYMLLLHSLSFTAGARLEPW